MYTAPGDYTSQILMYTFTPGQTRLDIPVTINDDSIFEGPEQFIGRLSTTSNAEIDIGMTTVTISDDDRKFIIALLNKKYRYWKVLQSAYYYMCHLNGVHSKLQLLSLVKEQIIWRQATARCATC